MSSGYDYSNRNPYRLMQGRLGIYDKRPYDPTKNSVEGIEEQSKRLRHMGGHLQQERMIKDKRAALDRAVWNSYQGAEVVRIDADYRKPVRCLINPNKLKQDYDDKILSVGYEHKYKTGDIIQWRRRKWDGTTDISYWLIYLQDLTELAYFRGDIRKCSYKISWEDDSGKHETYAAVRGPVETKINYIQKHGISVDTPNHSLHILMPLNEYTLKYFQRYKKFYLNSFDDITNKICWRVEATDAISTPGILEINAVEYYANEHEDDIENGIVGGLIIEPDNPNEENIEDLIIGETFIKPQKYYHYRFNGAIISNWIYNEKLPIKVKMMDDDEIEIKWTANYSGQFDLEYGDYKKTIIVESLF